MGQADTKTELIGRLLSLPSLAHGNFQIDTSSPDGVLISCGGHLRGIWQIHSNGFQYIPAGYNEAVHTAESAADAAQITLKLYADRTEP